MLEVSCATYRKTTLPFSSLPLLRLSSLRPLRSTVHARTPAVLFRQASLRCLHYASATLLVCFFRSVLLSFPPSLLVRASFSLCKYYHISLVRLSLPVLSHRVLACAELVNPPPGYSGGTCRFGVYAFRLSPTPGRPRTPHPHRLSLYVSLSLSSHSMVVSRSPPRPPLAGDRPRFAQCDQLPASTPPPSSSPYPHPPVVLLRLCCWLTPLAPPASLPLAPPPRGRCAPLIFAAAATTPPPPSLLPFLRLPYCRGRHPGLPLSPRLLPPAAVLPYPQP